MGTHKPHWCPQPRFLLNSPHPQCLLSHWKWSAGGSTLANATQPELMIRPSLSTGCVVSRIVHLCYDAAFKFNAECAGCRLCFYFGLCDVTLCDGDKIHGVMVLKCKDFMFHCVFFHSRVWARWRVFAKDRRLNCLSWSLTNLIVPPWTHLCQNIQFMSERHTVVTGNYMFTYWLLCSTVIENIFDQGQHLGASEWLSEYQEFSSNTVPLTVWRMSMSCHETGSY